MGPSIHKTFLILGLFSGSLFLGACSDSTSHQEVPRVQPLVVDTPSFDFGSMEQGASVADKIFTFTKGSSVEADTSFVLDSQDFAIVSSTGCNKILKKNTEKCYLKVRFLKNKVVGDYEAELVVGSGEEAIVVPLSASVFAPPEDPGTFLITEGSIPVDSLAFGALNKNTAVNKVLTIKNEGTKEVVVSTGLLGDGKFSITSNNCSTLKAKKTCQVRLALKTPASPPLEDEDILGSFLVNDTVVELTGLFRAEAVVVGNPIIKVYEGSEELEFLDFGSLSSGTIQKVLTIKNEGNATQEGSASFSGDSAFVITSNNCSSLKAGKNCFVKVSFVFHNQVGGSKNGILSFGAKSFPLTGSIASAEPESPTALLKLFDGSSELSTSLVLGNSAVNKVLTLKNVGAEPAEVLSSTVEFVGSGDFSLIKSCPSILNFGGSCSITLSYSASSGRTAQGTLRLQETFTFVKAGTGGVFSSCENAKANGVNVDGVISVDIDGGGPKGPFPVYCKDMASTPTTYLNLVMKSTLDNPKSNYSDYDCPGLSYCTGQATTVYSKIRISLPDLEVDVFDDTFSQSNGYSYYQEFFASMRTVLPLGYAGTCSGQPGSHGNSNVDLRGTMLSLHEDTSWGVSSGSWSGSLIIELLSPKESKVRGRGYCGGSSSYTNSVEHLIKLKVD